MREKACPCVFVPRGKEKLHVRKRSTYKKTFPMHMEPMSKKKSDIRDATVAT